MKNRKKEKYLKTILPLLFTTLLILTVWTGYKLIFKKKDTFLDKIDTSYYANITYEAIYGIHLNLKGNFELPNEFAEVNLVLANEKEEIPITYESSITDNTYYFNTSDYINEGLNLENLQEGTYYLVLKCVYNSETKYYSVQNKTNYNDLEYYTLTKNGKNNLITIKWNTSEICPTLRFDITDKNLPDEVYDITIDAGHGVSCDGIYDSGSIGTLNNKEYEEAEMNLSASKKLKEELESLGYKVAMTRNNKDDKICIYGKNGSATMANDTKSKFNIAIHHNSFAYQVDYLKGLEVYIANDTETTLANLFIENIVNEAGTVASPKETYAIAPGIYQRFFTEEEILEDEVQPSNKTTDTIYYYNLREVGGISTHAGNDGRYEPELEKNEYYNSNNTAESYLLELGYLNNEKDLQNLVNNQDGYAKGIAKALDEYLKTEK